MTSDVPYEKMQTSETPSSVVLLGGHLNSTYRQPAVQVRHYFVFSLISSLLLCPASGLIALAYSLKSSAKADVQFYEKAKLYSRRALLWNLISLVLFMFSVLMVFVFFYYLGEIMKIYATQLDDAVKQTIGDVNINNRFNRIN